MKTLIAFLVVVVIAMIGYNLFTFTVDETQKAAVLRFGEIVRIVEEPGLYFKIPFIQSVTHLEDRVLNYDIQPLDVYTADQKRLSIDNYAIWRVGDPQQFIESTGGRLNSAQGRIDEIVFSDLIRADLPSEIEQAVFERMRSERLRIAAQLRAEGEEKARQITSSADKEVEIILADANKGAEIVRGEGDAQALEIYAEAYNQDPDFYRFWRTLESYRVSLASNTRIILSSDSDYLRYLESMLDQ
jgi:membrane protease subunit HflC